MSAEMISNENADDPLELGLQKEKMTWVFYLECTCVMKSYECLVMGVEVCLKSDTQMKTKASYEKDHIRTPDLIGL